MYWGTQLELTNPKEMQETSSWGDAAPYHYADVRRTRKTTFGLPDHYIRGPVLHWLKP